MTTQPFIDLIDPRPKKPVRFLADYSVALASMPTVGYVLWFGRGIQDARSQWRRWIAINRLVHKNLSRPLHVIIEPDDHGYVAKTPDLPLYGFGEDRNEAVAMLQREIESLYDDLMEDDNFGEEWIQAKDFLKEIVIGQR